MSSTERGPVATRRQAGVVTRAQLLDAGFSPDVIRGRVASGRWQRVDLGVYALFSGAVPDRALLWAALLRAGAGAVAGPSSTLWLTGVVDRRPERWDVLIPEERRVRGRHSARITRRRGLETVVHPTATPPQLRIEQAVLDAADLARRDEDAVGVVVRGVQRGRTTARHLSLALAERPRHSRRQLLLSVLDEVTDGVRSMLELRWRRTVERAHGLPAAERNHPDDVRGRRYRDLEYVRWQLVIELDGREAHPDDERFRDRERDNVVTVTGRATLRYGWHEVTADPCAIAAEVATVLRARGWTGALRPCGSGCRAA